MANVYFFYLLFGCPGQLWTTVEKTVNLLFNQILITAFYLFWLERQWKPLDRKFFVDAPLEGWLVTTIIPAPKSATEHLRTDAEIICEIGCEGFLF